MNSYDTECPYCGKDIDICHDDGAGYAEDEQHQQECEHCEKTFVFTTYVSYIYDATKADCLNGSEHKMAEVTHTPRSWPDWKRCETCGHEERGQHYAAQTCPRRNEGSNPGFTLQDWWRTGDEKWGVAHNKDAVFPDAYEAPRTCSYCGSAHPEDVLKLLNAKWDHEKATGKEYKGYLYPPGYIAQILKPRGEKPDVRGTSPMVKFYTMHFDSSQLAELNAFLRSEWKR